MAFVAASVEGVAAVVAAAAAVSQSYTAHQTQVAQGRANQAAVAAAKMSQQQADEANNQANARRPDVDSILAANMAAGKQGAAGTMLTGPGGVDPSTLTLGRSSILGG